MGIVSRSLGQLAQQTNRWWAFASGETAPMHVLAGRDQENALGSGNPLPVAIEATFLERCMREGEPYSDFSNSSVTPASGAVNTTVTSSNQLPFVGKVVFIDELVFTVNQSCVAQAIIGGANNFTPYTQQYIMAAGAPVSVRLGKVFRAFNMVNGIISLAVRRMLSSSPGTDVIYGAVAVHGWKITDDLNFDAAKVVLFIGDSILNGTGPTVTANMWAFRVKEYLKGLGYDLRIVLKSVSGTTTSNWEIIRAGGGLDLPQVDAGVYALSVNDAGQAPTVTISNASPSVVTESLAHGLVAGDVVQFATTGSLPTGLTTGTNYYVLSAGLTSTTYQIAATSGGVAINTSSAGSGVHSRYSTKVYLANLTSLWAWWQRTYTQAPLVICGTTPLNNNISEGFAVLLRAAAASFVASQASPKLKFVDFGATFDRTVLANYNTGDGVHPLDGGHAAIATAFTTAWPSLGLTF